MILETIFIAIILAVVMTIVRTYWRTVIHYWHQARWWERALLLLCALPIPGPFDELAAAVLFTRIAKRKISGTSNY